MATEVLRKSFNNVDADGILDEGIQPGLSRESLLVISGSYDDLTNCVIAESVRGVRVDNGDNSSSRPDVINRTLTSIQDLEGKIIDSSEDSANVILTSNVYYMMYSNNILEWIMLCNCSS